MGYTAAHNCTYVPQWNEEKKNKGMLMLMWFNVYLLRTRFLGEGELLNFLVLSFGCNMFFSCSYKTYRNKCGSFVFCLTFLVVI